MRQLRVGIAGAGWVAGARHVPSLIRAPGVEIVAVYDRSVARAEALVAKIGRRQRSTPVRVCSRLSDMLAMGLDAVFVATSPWSHAEIAIESMNAGAHVFTEKPMAMSLSEARSMVEVSVATGKAVCVSHNFLFSKAMATARAELAGESPCYVAGLQLSSERRRLPAWYRDLPGGLFFDESPHLLYCLGDLLGGPLQVEYARTMLGQDGHPRSVEVLLRGTKGPGQITSIFDAPVSEWHVMVAAPGRCLGLDLFRDITVTLNSDGSHGPLDIARSSLSMIGGHLAGSTRTGARLLTKRQFWGHDLLIEQFLASVRGEGPVPVRIEDALAVVQATESILEASGLMIRA